MPGGNHNGGIRTLTQTIKTHHPRLRPSINFLHVQHHHNNATRTLHSAADEAASAGSGRGASIPFAPDAAALFPAQYRRLPSVLAIALQSTVMDL